MGILNATPDSFHADSRTKMDTVLEKAQTMINAGAAILDVGGQSTRPGAEMVGPDIEITRVVPLIKTLKTAHPQVLISIDSFYPAVVQEAVKAGADLVNDISAGLFFPEMLSTVAALNTPYIAMHMGGSLENMHHRKPTDHISRTVLDFFIERKAACLAAGIKDLIIDPGFGFGNTTEENFQLIRDLGILKMLDCPILLGVSRKSSIYKTLGVTAAEALNGTTVLQTAGLLAGANLLRVHDVKEAKEAIILTSYIQ
ncbi:MAG: dihydropteroate synthase [Bacteroidetes bacterium 24-39-8]|jgi:dihydropteroate synthase|nr:MAG: dihydropteroate synthase [Sphingobacteriia bacterium 35-40-8]OYZ50805.1 MAG: dihydropteroate synthase [Bacteroidetes bacterium 24-39-8]OZA65440.1 MAG: dihydropteroate synthase [Sphingobacteriia bacterium 39-39-8]